MADPQQEACSKMSVSYPFSRYPFATLSIQFMEIECQLCDFSFPLPYLGDSGN